MIDLNKNYETRDRRAVRLFLINEEGETPVLGAIRGPGGVWKLQAWRRDGTCAVSDFAEKSLIEKVPRAILVHNTFTGALSIGKADFSHSDIEVNTYEINLFQRTLDKVDRYKGG